MSNLNRSSSFRVDRIAHSGQVRSSRREAHRARCGGHGAIFEAIESRQLLAADLGISFDAFTGVPATLVPGDRLGLPLTVTNQGDRAVDGKATIRFYLSKNTTFDADDKLMSSFPNETFKLAAEGFPNNAESFSATVTVPTVDPGDYFFLVRIEPEAAIGDLNQTNNVAAKDGTAQNFAWFFGNFGTRTNAMLTLTSADGVAVTFGLNGGGKGTVTKDAVDTDRFDVLIENTGASSRAGITATGGTGANANIGLIDDVTVNGSLAALDGPSARLLGDVKISGTAGLIRFNQIQGPSLIEVRTAGVNTALDLGTVNNLVFTSVGGVASLAVKSWTDTDTALDRVQALWIGTLTSTGSFQASLELAGRTGGRTLDSVTIGGTVSKGAWDVNGRAGNWTFKAIAGDWSGSIKNNLVSLTVTGVFRGKLAAKAFTTITTGGFANAVLLAGVDFGEDARFGGTGADADTFSSGTINTIKVNGKVLNTIVGAGLDPTDSQFKDGDDVLRTGRINSVVVTKTVSAGSRFLARRYSATGPYKFGVRTIDTSVDQRFKLDAPPAATVPLIKDVVLNSPTSPTQIEFTITDPDGLDVSTLGNGDLVLSGPGGLMIALSYVFPVTPPSGTSITVQFVISPPGGIWDAADNGMYEIRVVDSAIKDLAGTSVAAGSISAFTIAL